MQIFRDIDDIAHFPRGSTLVLGSFDGVHRGHAALVAAARQRARPVGVITFSPHPRLLTQAAQPPFLLTPNEEKYAALQALAVTFCVELPFTREFASVSAETFVSRILVEWLGADHVICGYNFRFGASRKGDVALLRQLGQYFGFSVENVAPVSDVAGNIYSSTRIRDCLRAGDVAGANAILGRAWTIKTRLQPAVDAHGPSGDFQFGAYLKPLPGHYNARVRFEDGNTSDAEIIVAQDDHAGWMKFPAQFPLNVDRHVEIELVELVAPLVAAQLYGDAGLSSACSI